MDVAVPGTPYVPTDVRAPELPSMLIDRTCGVDWLPTNKYFPLGSPAMKLGCAPVLNCELACRLRPPFDPMENTVKFAEPWFATYINFPDFSIMSAMAPVYGWPSGDPGKGLNEPSELMLNSETVLSILLAVYKKLPFGEMARPAGSFPVT